MSEFWVRSVNQPERKTEHARCKPTRQGSSITSNLRFVVIRQPLAFRNNGAKIMLFPGLQSVVISRKCGIVTPITGTKTPTCRDSPFHRFDCGSYSINSALPAEEMVDCHGAAGHHWLSIFLFSFMSVCCKCTRARYMSPSHVHPARPLNMALIYPCRGSRRIFTSIQYNWHRGSPAHPTRVQSVTNHRTIFCSEMQEVLYVRQYSARKAAVSLLEGKHHRGAHARK